MASLVYTFAALDPRPETQVETWDIGLESSQMNSLLHRDGTARDGMRLLRLQLAKQVAENPTAVYRGLRIGHENDLFYFGKPDRDFKGFGKETPPQPNKVFCVVVMSSGKISDWRWELADPQKTDYPENWSDRFGEKIWPIS